MIRPLIDRETDLELALEAANRNLKETDQKYRDLLRNDRERNPEPDELLRGMVCIDQWTERHERPYAEREEFDKRMQAAVEKTERRNYILRVHFFRFSAIPTEAKGSVGFDREWTANLILGSVRRELQGTAVGASYQVEVL